MGSIILSEKEIEPGMKETILESLDGDQLFSLDYDPHEALAQELESPDWREDYLNHRESEPVTGKNLASYVAECKEIGKAVDVRAVGISEDLLVLKLCEGIKVINLPSHMDIPGKFIYNSFMGYN